MASKKQRSKAYVAETVEIDDPVEHVAQDEVPVEIELEAVVEPEESPLTYLVKDGENILTVAEKFKPAGVSRADYAKTLDSLNSKVAPGRLVRLG